MHENDEFSITIGGLMPEPQLTKINQTLEKWFTPTDSGELDRDYFCPYGIDAGLAALVTLKHALKRENGDVLRFTIDAPVPRACQMTLTNVVIELK